MLIVQCNAETVMCDQRQLVAALHAGDPSEFACADPLNSDVLSVGLRGHSSALQVGNTPE